MNKLDEGLKALDNIERGLSNWKLTGYEQNIQMIRVALERSREVDELTPDELLDADARALGFLRVHLVYFKRRFPNGLRIT